MIAIEPGYFFTISSRPIFFRYLPDRPANKIRARRANRLPLWSYGAYFISPKGSADRSIDIRQRRGPRRENKQRLHSRGIKDGIYRDESPGHLKRRAPTSLSRFSLSPLSANTALPTRMIKWAPELGRTEINRDNVVSSSAILVRDLYLFDTR